MDHERYSQWVRRSFRWVREEKDKHLPHHVQMLGIVDADLRGLRHSDLFDLDGRPLEDEYGILLLERYQIQAHLWLLGAYEFVRMLNQRLRDRPEYASDESIAKVIETKKLFERVRMPLAKLEAAKRFSETDYEIAYAGIGERGLGWKVADAVVIYQEDLSNALFDMLCHLRPRTSV